MDCLEAASEAESFVTVVFRPNLDVRTALGMMGLPSSCPQVRLLMVILGEMTNYNSGK